MAPRVMRMKRARRAGKRTGDTPAQATAENGLPARVNRELYKRNAELAVRNKTLALLRKLDGISMSAITLSEMAREITHAIAVELGYDVVSLSLATNGGSKNGVLQMLTISSPVSSIHAELQQLPARSVAIPLRNALAVARAIREAAVQISVHVKDVYPPEIVHALDSARRDAPALASFLVYPLSIGHRPLGALTVGAARDLHRLTRYEREALEGIIGLVSLALHKAQIYEDLEETSAKLRVANVQLAQLDKAKSEFLSIASHQLYTPLTAIKGYLSMVREGDYGRVTKKLQPVVNILRQSSERLIDLIRNLLDVSRIESGRLELDMGSVDLVAMARDLVMELTPNVQRKNLALVFQEPPKKLPLVVADAQRLRQVLLNILDNAIKYTDTGRIDVRVVYDGDTLVYSVQDTGKGILPEEVERLFAKFSRVGGADRYHTEGTGLGLYVARQIVREHHGNIWVTSPGKGKGSTFSVKLPIEGSQNALKAGTTITVGIKAAEAGEKAR